MNKVILVACELAFLRNTLRASCTALAKLPD